MDLDLRTPSDPGPDPDDRFDDDPPPVPVALLPGQRTELGATLENALREGGCDGTLRAAQRWARAAGVPWPALHRQLEDNGGYCDCEVLLNVLAADEDAWA